MEKEECKEMDAGEVYVLMKGEYRISRNIRASWFFGNLNKFISINNPDEHEEDSSELEVLSVLPKVRSQQPHPYSPGCQCKFRLVPSTHVTFLARRYRFVIVLDLSPSMATVDIQSGRISLVDIYSCMDKCLRGLTRPFCVPGSRVVIAPKLYVTVIAYTPLAALTTQQVMVQGCLLTTDNLDMFLEKLQLQLDDFENKIVHSMFTDQDKDNEHGAEGGMASCNDRDEINPKHAQSEGSNKLIEPEIASPEAGFVNMLWCGILALQLLPENSSAGIIVVTDGVTAMPDAAATNILLAQMRSSTIACSFLQVGKGFHPHCSFGYIPHTEIMQFIATATFGAFLSKCPDMENSKSNSINQYHTSFLSWHFQKGLESMKIDYVKKRHHQVISSEIGWSSEGIQPSFTVNKHGMGTIPLITKKHMEVTLHASLSSVLSVRLREGYTIKDVNITKNETQIEVKLALPWKYNGRIEYKATSLWPLNHNRRITFVEVIMEGSYEFLHDVTCPQRGPQNTYRAKVVRNFWHTLRSLKETDQLLVHLQSFSTNPIFYTVPEGTRKGMPLFYMPPNSDVPVLAQKLDKKDSTVEQFAEFWKRITLMDSKRWQRWLHTHRLALLLVPDLPLPKYLYLPSSNGRYNSIQCRMALKELNSILRDISTFILLENHSYISLMSEDPKGPPTSFYLVRVTSKAPGVVLRLGFLGGTPGHVRNKIVKELREKLQAITIPQKLSHLQESGFIYRMTSRKTVAHQSQAFTGRHCVILLSRPMDMILVKYEKMPADFTDLKTSIQVTVASVPVYMDHRGPVKALNRLACYLHHQRWIWDAQSDSNTPISATAVANVLSVLTKMRLQEGFHFSYSNSGIISFVTEIHMRNPMQLSISDDEEDDTHKKQEVFPCLVQYILFPPHTTTFVRERLTSGSLSDHWGSDLIDDSDTAEADGRLQLVTECWIEPQSGTAFDLPQEQQHFFDATYTQLPSLMYPIDHEVISTLLTYEHLKAHCSGIAYSNSPLNALRASPSKVANLQFSESIGHIPFQLDLMKLVTKSQQVEILCSTFINEIVNQDVYREDNQENNQEGNQDGDHDPQRAEQERHLYPPKPNDTLFCLLLDALKHMSNHEVLLTPEESIEFIKSVLARDRSESQTQPFSMTDDKLKEMEEFARQQQQLSEEAGKSTTGQLDDSHSSFNPESSGYSRFEVQPKSPIPQWTCYVHNVESPSSQLILTFIPATYKDLQKLMQSDQDTDKPEQEVSEADRKNRDDEKKDEEIVEIVSAADNLDPEGQDVNMAPESETGLPDNKEEAHSSPDEPKPDVKKQKRKSIAAKPLALPIYVYDCSMADLKSYLLDPEPHIKFSDIFDDLTFPGSGQTDIGAKGSGSRPAYTRQNSRTHSTSWYQEASKMSEGQESDNKKSCSKGLQRFHRHLAHVIQRSFGLGIFMCLQRNQSIHAQDVQSAMDYVCLEADYEIDITEFVLSVCEHIRDFGESPVLEDEKKVDKEVDEAGKNQADKSEDTMLLSTQSSIESQLSQESNQIDHADIDTPGEDDNAGLYFASDKKQQISIRIPLEVLGSQNRCNASSGLHEAVKGHFQDIMGKHFKSIPTNKDFWYFSQDPDVDDLQIDSECKDTGTTPAGSDSNTEATTNLPPRKSSTEYQALSEEELDSQSDYSGSEDTWKGDGKINSVVDVYQSVARNHEEDEYNGSEDGGTSNESVMGSVDDSSTTPLFINLLCYIKLKSNVGNRTVQTIPTCLNDLIQCLENAPGELLDLSELSVVLDILSLTLPPDFNEDDVLSGDLERTREMSLTEQSPPVSPLPRDDPFADSTATSMRTVSTSDMEFGNPAITDALCDLPDVQRKAIQETADEIKWLLKDEIASAKCLVFPPVIDTLEMVAEHVKKSHEKPSCITEQVKLQFVFGAEHSLEKFQEQFEQMEIPNYMLNKVEYYYHLMTERIQLVKVEQEHLQSALELLGQIEPCRLMPDKSSDAITGASQTSSTTVICTPPTPVKEAKAKKDTLTTEDEDEFIPVKDDLVKDDLNKDSATVQLEGSSVGVLPENTKDVNEDVMDDNTDVVVVTDDDKGDKEDIEIKDVNTEELVQTKEDVMLPQDNQSNIVFEEERGEYKPNSDEDKQEEEDDNRSSGSSIQILSEDHFGDIAQPDNDAKANLDVADLSSADQQVVPSDKDKDLVNKEVPQEVEDSSTSDLRRNASFVVLSNSTHDKEEKADQSPDSAEEAVEVLHNTEPAAGRNTEDQDNVEKTSEGKERSHSADGFPQSDSTENRPTRSASSSSAPDVFTDANTSLPASATGVKSDNELSASLSPATPKSYSADVSGQSTTVIPKLTSKYRHASGMSNRSSASGPPSSQISYTSLNGSFNEYDDGYDASSSDNEGDESSSAIPAPPSLGKKQQCMPEFWLIMKVESDKVDVFFHARDRGNHDQKFSEYKEVYNRVTENIRNICRQVNQRLLLQDLNDTRICKSLLVAESDEDIWQTEDASKSRVSFPQPSELDGDDMDLEAKDYLAAAMDFNPSHFACDEIWYTLLPVHSRLKSSHRGGTASRGLQSVKTTLIAFAVTNRRNMFVYKGKTGDVFYLRLSEATILNYDSSRHGSIAEGGKLTSGDLSRVPSIQSLNTTYGSAVFDDDQVSQDYARSLATTDSGMETLGSSQLKFGSSGQYRSDHCIKLSVHGIAGPEQPGPEVEQELVQVLKNRLDDTTLDVISAMLARNPMLKLTSDDVQFIQPHRKEPTDTVHCTIPQSAMRYLFSIQYYLRQNLRQFLNLPKYIDGRAENHFKAKCAKHEHITAAHADNNIFLYNRPHESGRTGIACISLCIVDTRGVPVSTTSNRPSPVTYVDPIQETDFEEYTLSERYLQKSEDACDPSSAFIEFAIWERGDVDLQHLVNNLMKAARHTMCDVVMEFRILTAPLGIPDDEDTQLESELKLKLESAAAAQPAAIASEHSVSSGSTSPRPTPMQSLKLLIDKDRGGVSSSNTSQVSSPKMLSPTGSGSKGKQITWQAHELERRHDEMAKQKQRNAAIAMNGSLHPVFSSVCLPWMEFEHNLQTPSVKKMTAEISSRFSIEPVLKELLVKIPNLCLNFTTKLYKQVGENYKLCDSTKATTMNESTCKPLPGANQNYFLIARDVHHWDNSLDYPSSEDLATHLCNDNPVSRKSLQQFPPLLLPSKSIPTTPAEKDPDTSLDPVLPSMVIARKYLVPRQHLLLIYICDRKMTFFTYNISGESQNGLENLFKDLVTWQNSRSDLLNCILSQKMGLFHSCDELPWSLEEIDTLIKCSTPPSKDHRRTGLRSKPTRRLHPGLPPFEETLRTRKMWKPLQQCSYGARKDPVVKHGMQILDICITSKKEAEVQTKLENLYVMWGKKKRGSYVRHPISIETLDLLKQSSQVFHYCATPLLFCPDWRQQVTRNASLDKEVCKDVASEPWLMDIRSSFVKQYVQFLKTLRFCPVELSTVPSPRHHIKQLGRKKDPRHEEELAARKHASSANESHLQLTVPGGIIMIDIAFQNAYFCVKLYAFESSKVPAGQAVNSQLSMLFTDECDKFKDQIHLHSFSYDFHLRTIQSYINAPEMGFKSRYHVTNFLEDVVNYYSPAPNFRRNHVHVESLALLSHNTLASQLYQYLMTNKPQHMKLLSMAELPSSTADAMDTDLVAHALYQIYPLSGYFKDASGGRQYGEFDVSLILTWDKDSHKNKTRPRSMFVDSHVMASPAATDARNPNLMSLKFYVIVTSRKDIFPRRIMKSKISPSETVFRDSSHGYQLLNTEAQNAKDKIVNMAKLAADDCRRDTLWQQLLIWDTEDVDEKKKKRKDSSSVGDETKTNQLTYPEFKVLLDHVHRVPFSECDQQIVPILNSSISWYDGLLQFLRKKFVTASRYLTSEDGQIKHLALLNPSHLDMMVLLTVDQQTNAVDLEAIFKKLPNQLHTAAHSPEYATSQELFTQRHIENVVNAVSCYLWTTLL